MKKKSILLLFTILYIIGRIWDNLLSYYAFLKSPETFILFEKNRAFVRFLLYQSTDFIKNEILGFVMFAFCAFILSLAIERGFKFPIIIGIYILGLSFSAPLTWFNIWVWDFWEILSLEKFLIIIVVMATAEFIKWLRRHFSFLIFQFII